MVNEQKIKALDERCKQLRKATDEKKQQLFELKQSIEQSKQAEEEDPIVAQLREHFKALKQEFGD